MTKYFSELLASLMKQMPREYTKQMVTFEVEVLRRYREQEGPWSLHRTDVTLYQWIDESPERMIVLPFTLSKRSVSVNLRDLAALPRSEQEHWRRFKID